MDDKKKNNKTYPKIKKEYSESYFDDDDTLPVDDSDPSMIAIAAPILMMIMAPGFVIYSARYNLDMGGAILMFILFFLFVVLIFLFLSLETKKKMQHQNK